VRIDDENDPKYLVTSEGSLVIREVTKADEANYTCVAYNDLFTRATDPARLYVFSMFNSSLLENRIELKQNS